MIDFIQSRVDLDVSLTDVKATVISICIGWNGKIGIFSGELRVRVMYQDISQSLDLPLDIDEKDLPVTIEQSTQEAYSDLIGGQGDLNRSFSLLVDPGFGGRNSQIWSISSDLQ